MILIRWEIVEEGFVGVFYQLLHCPSYPNRHPSQQKRHKKIFGSTSSTKLDALIFNPPDASAKREDGGMASRCVSIEREVGGMASRCVKKGKY